MKDGYYLSDYIHINKLSYLLNLRIRYNQNISLWKKDGDNLTLIHLWKLEDYTGLREHPVSFYSCEQAIDIINYFLNEYNLSLSDMIEVWGTPELDTCSDGYSMDRYPTVPFHSVAHLFSVVMANTDVFYHDTTIGLVLDSEPDSVIDKQSINKDFYTGCIIINGKIQLFPISSPQKLWVFVKNYYNIPYAIDDELILFAKSCHSQYYLNNLEKVVINNDRDCIKLKKLLNSIINSINNLTEKDQGIKFTSFDSNFSIEENKKAMFIKVILYISQTMLEDTIESIKYKYNIDTKNVNLAICGENVMNGYCSKLLMEKYKFKQLIATSYANDSGISIGIALYSFYKKNGKINFNILNKSLSCNYSFNHKLYNPYISNITKIDLDTLIKDIINGPIVWINTLNGFDEQYIIASPKISSNLNLVNSYRKQSLNDITKVMILNEDIGRYFNVGYKTLFNMILVDIKDKKKDSNLKLINFSRLIYVKLIDSIYDNILYKILIRLKPQYNIQMLLYEPLISNSSISNDKLTNAIHFCLLNNIDYVYINNNRVKLKKITKIDISRIPENLLKFDIFNKQKKEKLLKKLNPYNIPSKFFYLSYRRPNFMNQYDYKNKEDANKIIKKLQIFVKLYLN